jgi:hypothetical protein
MGTLHTEFMNLADTIAFDLLTEGRCWSDTVVTMLMADMAMERPLACLDLNDYLRSVSVMELTWRERAAVPKFCIRITGDHFYGLCRVGVGEDETFYYYDQGGGAGAARLRSDPYVRVLFAPGGDVYFEEVNVYVINSRIQAPVENNCAPAQLQAAAHVSCGGDPIDLGMAADYGHQRSGNSSPAGSSSSWEQISR